MPAILEIIQGIVKLEPASVALIKTILELEPVAAAEIKQIIDAVHHIHQIPVK
jgi:hypothetical protein